MPLLFMYFIKNITQISKNTQLYIYNTSNENYELCCDFYHHHCWILIDTHVYSVSPYFFIYSLSDRK